MSKLLKFFILAVFVLNKTALPASAGAGTGPVAKPELLVSFVYNVSGKIKLTKHSEHGITAQVTKLDPGMNSKHAKTSPFSLTEINQMIDATVAKILIAQDRKSVV